MYQYLLNMKTIIILIKKSNFTATNKNFSKPIRAIPSSKTDHAKSTRRRGRSGPHTFDRSGRLERFDRFDLSDRPAKPGSITG